MALSNTVQLRDGMSNVLSRIASSLSTVNDRFERMQSLTEQAAPTGLYAQFNSELTGVREELTRTVSEVEELRSSMTSAQPPAENLTASLKKLGTAFLGSKLVSGIVSMSDEMTQTTARLNLMNDGLQSTADLQELIYQSAMRSRGAYNATADAVAKMGLLAGDAFSSNQETIAFVEQLNKQFKIAGTSAEGQAAAMLQITQAMGSGVLRGEELNSVFEQAPTIIQSIADYLGVSVGEIRSMAQEGELTAGVVKSALLSSAEQTNQKFNEIPLTWSDVWTQASNMAIMALQPLLEAINWVANNIEVIGPLVLAAAAAFALFAVAANWTKICAAATKALTAAQKMLNAVMFLSMPGKKRNYRQILLCTVVFMTAKLTALFSLPCLRRPVDCGPHRAVKARRSPFLQVSGRLGDGFRRFLRTTKKACPSDRKKRAAFLRPATVSSAPRREYI